MVDPRADKVFEHQTYVHESFMRTAALIISLSARQSVCRALVGVYLLMDFANYTYYICRAININRTAHINTRTQSHFHIRSKAHVCSNTLRDLYTLRDTYTSINT